MAIATTFISGWRQDARTIMLISFVLAACSAIGHHFFYYSLQGRRTNQGGLSQNENIYLGTTFAFFTKAFLSAAVCAAYTQVLWHTLIRRKLRVDHIDALSVLALSPTAFDDIRLLKFPLLVLLAVVAWCVSIVSIFPPGTLSVAIQIVDNSTSISVPSLDFTLPLVQINSSRSLGHSGVNINSSDLLSYQVPAPPRQVASALSTVTALTGEIPRIPNLSTNTSYSSGFFAPALQCSTSEIMRERVYCSGDENLFYVSFLTYPQDSGSSFGDFFDLDDSLPLGSDGNISCNSITSYRNTVFGVEPPRLHVLLRTSTHYGDDASDTRWGWNATTCQLVNATYAIDVEISDSVQKINATLSEYTPLKLVTEYIPGFNTSDSDMTGPTGNKIYNYLAMIALMGQVTLGTLTSSSDATNLLITDGGVQDLTVAPVPSIFSTRLSTSPEIQAFKEDVSILSSLSHATTFVSTATSPPIARQLEDLFMNLTLAMLTNPETSSNATVQLKHWYPVNIYVYSAWHLWLSYGIGLLITAVVIVLGYAATSSNGASYSTTFSTYLRTTPWSQLEGKLSGSVDDGADPVPENIGHAKIMLGHDHAAVSGIEMVDGSQGLKTSSKRGLLGGQ